MTDTLGSQVYVYCFSFEFFQSRQSCSKFEQEYYRPQNTPLNFHVCKLYHLYFLSGLHFTNTINFLLPFCFLNRIMHLITLKFMQRIFFYYNLIIVLFQRLKHRCLCICFHIDFRCFSFFNLSSIWLLIEDKTRKVSKLAFSLTFSKSISYVQNYWFYYYVNWALLYELKTIE